MNKVKIIVDQDYFEEIFDSLDVDKFTILSVEDTQEQDRLKFEYYQRKINGYENKGNITGKGKGKP